MNDKILDIDAILEEIALNYKYGPHQGETPMYIEVNSEDWHFLSRTNPDLHAQSIIGGATVVPVPSEKSWTLVY